MRQIAMQTSEPSDGVKVEFRISPMNVYCT